MKVILGRHWMHVTQVHPVTSENHFHCTGLYCKIGGMFSILVNLSLSAPCREVRMKRPIWSWRAVRPPCLALRHRKNDLLVFFWLCAYLQKTERMGPCALRHGIQTSMEAIWHATQLYPQNNWTGWQYGVSNDVYAQAPLHSVMVEEMLD